jgi:hypothetical protein
VYSLVIKALCSLQQQQWRLKRRNWPSSAAVNSFAACKGDWVFLKGSTSRCCHASEICDSTKHVFHCNANTGEIPVVLVLLISKYCRWTFHRCQNIWLSMVAFVTQYE